jgi:hypothetical protein
MLSGATGFAAILAGSLCVPACTDGAGGPSEAVPSTLAPASSFEREVAELCDLVPSGDGLSVGLRNALTKGEARFQPEEAARCITWLRENGCLHAGTPEMLSYLVLRLPGLCRLAYIGSVPTGGQCSHSVACTDDAHCQAVSESSAHCVPRVPPGAQCFSPDECSVSAEEIPACAPSPDGDRQCAVDG